MNKRAIMNKQNRLFPHIDSWADSAGYYAVMPVEFYNEDCYIVLDSDGRFGIYRNNAEEPFMEEDMVYTGHVHNTKSHEIYTWLWMLTILRDMWRR